MAALNRTFKHGQTWELAKANFETGIRNAEARHGAHFRSIEWSDDRTSARLRGKGFELHVRVDPECVHVTGQVPFFMKAFEGPLMRFIAETFQEPGSGG
jgi:hypothetical protein